MTTNSLDTLLDRLHRALTGSTRERPGFSDAAALAAAFALVVAAFGFELANNTLGVDDYSHLDFPFRWDSFWIGRGSWGALAVHAVTPGGWITPFISLAVGLLIQLLAAVVLAWALRARGTTASAQGLLYALFATFPYFACQMAFSYVQIAYPLASLLMVCSVVLALASGVWRMGCAIVACAFAISIYQGSISVLVPVALLAPLAHEAGPRETWRRYNRVLAAAAGGAALYVAAHWVILAVTGIAAQSAYYSVTFDWRFWERRLAIRQDIDYLFLGAGDVIPPVAVVIFVLAAAGAGAYAVSQQRGLWRRLSAAGLWLLLAPLLAVAPFAVLYVHAGQLAPRSSVGLAVVWFAVFALLLRAPADAVRRTGLMALAVVVVLFAFQVNRMFYSQHLVSQADRLMMARIAERIDQLPIDLRGEPLDVVIIGTYSHPPHAGMPRFGGDVLGFSQFEWDPVDTRWQIAGLARASASIAIAGSAQPSSAGRSSTLRSSRGEAPGRTVAPCSRRTAALSSGSASGAWSPAWLRCNSGTARSRRGCAADSVHCFAEPGQAVLEFPRSSSREGVLVPHPLFERHAVILERALTAIGDRGYWSPHSESPKAYGEGAIEAGKAAFDALLNKPFELDQPGTVGTVGREVSPFGIPLGISYPKADLDALFAAVAAAEREWKKAGPEAWVGVAMETLHRINRASLLFANAVMHTTGQAFMMAFQAGGPHAQDRALEAIAYAWSEMKRIPEKALWEKPQGKNEPLRMEKHFRIVPRGVGLVIGCNTFPTWNGFPGFFADLSTGNAVVVKPHPNAILPLALMVRIAREVLAENGFDPNVVTLVAHDGTDDTAQKLALRPEVRLIDFTGSAANGNWLEANAKQAQVYTEKSGVNQIIVDSSEDFASLVRNIAFSLSLYTGQMCTAPQNIYVPKDGIDTAAGRLSFDQVASGIAEGVQKLLSDPARAVEILGAVVNDGVMQRLDKARLLGNVVLDSQAIAHPAFPQARIRTPLIVKLGAADLDKYLLEWFGPIAFVIATESTTQSLAIARDAVKTHGALTLSVYSRNKDVIDQAIEVAEDAGVALSINLTGGVFVNQSAAFSDFHGTGANPAANAALTDAAFVASRFRVVQHRQHV